MNEFRSRRSKCIHSSLVDAFDQSDSKIDEEGFLVIYLVEMNMSIIDQVKEALDQFNRVSQ